MVQDNWGMEALVMQPMWISHHDAWAFMSMCQELAFISDAPCNQVPACLECACAVPIG